MTRIVFSGGAEVRVAEPISQVRSRMKQATSLARFTSAEDDRGEVWVNPAVVAFAEAIE